MQQHSSLKSKTFRGLFWSFADLLANYGVQFIVQIALARLLLPEHFGIIGMILVLIAISNAVVDSGFSQALIRDQKTSQEDYSTVFYFNLIISLLIYFIIFVSAPFISEFFRVPLLIDIARVLSLVLIINALAIIQKVKLAKNLDFKALTTINFIAVIISGSIAISMAFLGFGVWSLVANMLSMQLIQTLSLWGYNRWLPSRTFNIQSFKRYFGFGYKLLLSGLIDTIYENLYFLMIGKFYSTTQLGYYTNAVKVRDMASTSIVAAVQRVTYPVLSIIQEDEERLKSMIIKIIKTIAFVHFPIMVGIAVIATPLFQVLFGEKWLPSVLYFQLLCIAGMSYPIQAINLNILKVKGRTDLFLFLEIIKKMVLTVLIILSLLFNLGIIGLIWTAVINSFTSLLITAYYSARLITYSTKNQMRDLTPIFLIAVAMGGVVLSTGYILPHHPIVKLLCQICIGIITYVLISKLFKIKELSTLYQFVYPWLLKAKLRFIK